MYNHIKFLVVRQPSFCFISNMSKNLKPSRTRFFTVPTCHRQLTLQEYTRIGSLLSNNYLSHPFRGIAAENNETVSLNLHYSQRFTFQLSQFHFRYLAFKYRILNPIQISTAKFQHFAHALLATVIYQYCIHFSDPFTTTFSMACILPYQANAYIVCNTPILSNAYSLRSSPTSCAEWSHSVCPQNF